MGLAGTEALLEMDQRKAREERELAALAERPFQAPTSGAGWVIVAWWPHDGAYRMWHGVSDGTDTEVHGHMEAQDYAEAVELARDFGANFGEAHFTSEEATC